MHVKFYTATSLIHCVMQVYISFIIKATKLTYYNIIIKHYENISLNYNTLQSIQNPNTSDNMWYIQCLFAVKTLLNST